jgi:diguanylate cyclase (GGDEF)-like protein
VRFPRARGLRARLLLLVLLAVVPALAVILYNGLQERRQAAAEARADAMALARGIATDQQRLILDTRQLLTLLSELPQVRSSAPDSCGAFLRQLLQQGSPYANLGLIAADGRIVCSAVPFPPGVTAADRPYFQRAMRTRDFAIGDYQIGRITGLATVNFGYPVLAPGGGVRAVVFAALPVTWLEKRIAQAELPAGSAATVIDPSLTILARYPDNARWAGKTIRETGLVAAIRESRGQGTAETTGVDGVPRLYAITPLLDLPGGGRVYLAVGTPASLAYASANHALTNNLVAILVLATLVLLAAAWGSEVFVLRQIRALLRATRRLGAGDLSARAAAADGRGEIRELAGSFNEMAGILEERAREASDHLASIARQNRVYAVLSGINSALLRIRDRDELLTELCRIAVEHGGFRMAMVHLVEPETDSLRTAAHAGAADAPAAAPGQAVGEDSLVRAARRDGREAIARELPPNAAGYCSAAAFPLRVDGAVVGVLSLYAVEPDFFDEEEVHLLKDLTADAALGLEYLEKERRLQYFAQYDPLTNLPNRTLFEDRLGQAVARARQTDRHAAVVVMDLVELPQINAALGHAAGDRALQEMAKYLGGAVRDGDTVSRLGSEEFGLLLVDVAKVADVSALLSSILDKAPRSLSVEDQEVYLSLRVGVALCPHDGVDGPSLVQKATLACHTDPAGGAVTFFSEALNVQVQRRREIERELRHAIERDELTLFYQPVVDVPSRVVVGVEGLLRWQSEALGPLSPGEFIPVAEQTGLIGALGEWIVVKACEQSRLWHQVGVPRIRINVNVSVDQLRQPDFVTRLTDILRDSGTDPASLALGIEITESALMEDVEAAVAAILHFRDLGLAIYVDDFGTGYSSLSYLRQLPIDTLKIDASFIRDIPGDPDAVAVVKGIIAMAHSLELRVIAEGVETEEQFAVLKELRCDAVQGYLFSKPARAEEIEALFGRAL